MTPQKSPSGQRAAERCSAEDQPLSSVETLFLDAGGVLVFPNWQRVSEALARRGIRITADALDDEMPVVMHELDRPDARHASDDDSRGLYLYHRVLERAGIERSPLSEDALREVRAYHDEHNLWEVVPPAVPGTLERLRAAGLRLVVVSNANATLERMLQRQGLADVFDVVIDSAVVGVEKPDRRIFEIALERSGADRETTLHAGDLFEVDVVGARSAGLRAALIDRAGLYGSADCPRYRDLASLARAFDG